MVVNDYWMLICMSWHQAKIPNFLPNENSTYVIEHAGFIRLIKDVESSAKERSGNLERGHCQKTSLVNLSIQFYGLTLSTKRLKATWSRNPA